MTRVKIDVLDRNRERIFNRIATRGVVKFFNVCNQEQKDLETKVKEIAGNSERKKDKILGSIDKGSFLDRLKEEDESAIENNKPKWSVLRDDFIMENGIKEWNDDNSDKEDKSDIEKNKNQKPKNKKKGLKNKKK